MSQSPATVCRAWFDGRRPTDASYCRVSGLILILVAHKAYMHAGDLSAQLHSLRFPTYIFWHTLVSKTYAFRMQLLHSMPACCREDAVICKA